MEPLRLRRHAAYDRDFDIPSKSHVAISLHIFGSGPVSRCSIPARPPSLHERTAIMVAQRILPRDEHGRRRELILGATFVGDAWLVLTSTARRSCILDVVLSKVPTVVSGKSFNGGSRRPGAVLMYSLNLILSKLTYKFQYLV